MAAKSAKDARRQEEKNRAEIEEEKRKRENLFNLRYHQDMTDRTEVQGMLRELREQQDAARSQNEAKGAVMGDTKEQQLAAEQGLNKAYADSVAGIASNASALKDGYLDRYDNSLANYYQQIRAHNTAMSQIEQNRSTQLSNAASNAASAAASGAVAIAGMVDGGPAKKAPATNSSKTIKTNPVSIGDNGMQIAQNGTITNPKLNSWDSFYQDMTNRYAIGKPSTPSTYPWLYGTTPTTFKRQ